MNNFTVDQMEVAVARGLLLLQLFTIFPLITYIWRSQLMLLFGVEETFCSIILVNTLVVTICIFFAIFMPKIGTIIRYTGASCGFVMIFFLPCYCKLKHQKDECNISAWRTFFRVHWRSASIHLLIIILGLTNMIAQFVFP